MSNDLDALARAYREFLDALDDLASGPRPASDLTPHPFDVIHAEMTEAATQIAAVVFSARSGRPQRRG